MTWPSQEEGTACAQPLRYKIAGRMCLEQGDISVEQRGGSKRCRNCSP